MVAFLIYIMKWALTLTLLYSLYGLLLRRETFHGFNRAVLLSILCLGMLLPLGRIETGHATFLSQHVNDMETAIYEFATAETVTEDGKVSAPGRVLALWPRVLVIVYVSGIVVCFVGYLFSLWSLSRMIVRGRRMQLDGLPRGVRVVLNRTLPTSCSWMRWIILNREDMARRGHPIVEHELAHVRLRHSWDMLFCELTICMLWFLPFVWMLCKDLRDLHEYQADRQVLRRGVAEEDYQCLLIRNAAGGKALTATNSFNHSSIKKRLVMMCRHPSTRKAALKAVYLLPLMGFVVTAFARPSLMEDIRHTLNKEEAAAPLLSPVALVESSVSGTPVEPEVWEEVIEEKPEDVQPEEPAEPIDSMPAVEPEPAPAVAEPRTESEPEVTPVKNGPVEVRRITTAPVTAEEFFKMDPYFWIEEVDGETHLTWLKYIKDDEEHIEIDAERCWLGDADTGDRYMCRWIEGYADKKVDIKLMHHKRSVVQFTLVFPPLEESVKRILFVHPGTNSLTVYKLKKVRREVPKIIR